MNICTDKTDHLVHDMHSVFFTNNTILASVHINNHRYIKYHIKSYYFYHTLFLKSSDFFKRINSQGHIPDFQRRIHYFLVSKKCIVVLLIMGLQGLHKVSRAHSISGRKEAGNQILDYKILKKNL